MLISRETPKDWIEVMPILYIDCLDCKMTTLNAPLQSKAYNVSKRIYNYLILEVWWHEVKTGWLGEQGRWSEFCVLISYRVCYSIACSQAYSAVAAWGGGGGGTPWNSRWGYTNRFSKSWPHFRPKTCHFPRQFSDREVVTKRNITCLHKTEIMSLLPRLKPQQKDFLKSNSNSHITLSSLFIWNWNNEHIETQL